MCAWETQTNGIINTAEIQNWMEGSKGNGILNGGGVVTSADVDLELDFTAFVAMVGGNLVVVSAGNITLAAADASDPRSDMVVVDSSGSVTKVDGTATTENSTTQPRPPLGTKDAGDLILATSYLPAMATVVLDANVFDRRIERNEPSAVSLIPRAQSALADALGVNQLATNTVGSGGSIVLDAEILVAKFTFEVTTVGNAGVVNFAVFSEDGQTRHISAATASVGGTGHVETTLGTAVLLPAGVYYVLLQPVSTADITVETWASNLVATTQVTGEPVHTGDVTGMSAGTMDATFDPTADLDVIVDSVPIIQLDA